MKLNNSAQKWRISMEENKKEHSINESVEKKSTAQRNTTKRFIGIDDAKMETKRIIIFLAITFGFGWLVEIGMIMPMYRSQDVDTVKEAVEMVSSMMFTPAIAALISRLATKEGLVKSGLQFNFSQHKFCFLFSWFGGSVLTFLGAIIYFMIFNDNYDPEMTDMVASAVKAGSEMSAVDIVAAFKADLLLKLFTAPLLDIVNSFGEEWGWRAYLLPKLYRKFGTVKAVLISGFAAGLWYAPLVALGYYYGQDYAGYPFTGIVAMCIFGMVTGCIYSFLALRTGSIFTSVFAHSAVSVMMSQAALFTKDGGNFFVGPAPTGIIAGIPFIVAGGVCLWNLIKNPIVSHTEQSN